MIQRAVIYLRVSTEDQTRGMSLESQEAICRAYCEREHITIDRESYRAADSDLRAQHHSADGVMVASHMTRYEARSIIEGSEQILASLSAMWNRMDGQQRRAFAAVLYPDGLVWSTDLVRTGASGSLFEKLRGLSAPELSLASPTGCNPNLFVIYDLLNSFKPLLGFAA